MKRVWMAALLLGLVGCDDHHQDSPFDTAGSNWNPPRLAPLRDTVAALRDSIRLCADGSDANSSELRYIWSLSDRPGSDTTTRSCFTFLPGNPGKITVSVRSLDPDGLTSPERKQSVDVHSFKPDLKLTALVSATPVGQSIPVLVQAQDTNGSIRMVRWGVSRNAWADSISGSDTLHTSYPPGGPTWVYAQAEDDDGFLSSLDSVQLLFDRPLESLVRTSPLGDTTGMDWPGISRSFSQWKVPFAWIASDPDGPPTGVNYSHFLDTVPNPTRQVYSGSALSDTVSVDTGLTYFWKVVATDSFGRSLSSPEYHFRSRIVRVPTTTMLSATAESHDKVSIAWAPSPLATSYIVSRTSSGHHIFLDTVTTTTFVDSTVADSTTYSYRVLAEGQDGGFVSNSLNVTTPGYYDLRVTNVLVNTALVSTTTPSQICVKMDLSGTTYSRPINVTVTLRNDGSRPTPYLPVNVCYATSTADGSICDNVTGGSISNLAGGSSTTVKVFYTISSNSGMLGKTYYFRGSVPNSAAGEDVDLSNNRLFSSPVYFYGSNTCNSL